MSDIQNIQMMEDPYYWRNKVLFWRGLNEVGHASWVDEVSKRTSPDNNQNQSALSKLWYKEGMQIDIDSKTEMADSLKSVISYIKDILSQAKENGDHNLLKEIKEDAELIDDQEERRIKALAVSAIAEADGHAPDAKKILDQIGSDQHKKLKTDLKQFIRPPSAQNNGR